MTTEHAVIKSALIHEVEVLRDEIQKLCADLDDRQFWAKPLEPGNSIGHLVLHLTGNLNYFVGAKLGGTGYVRDREREFGETETPPKGETLSRLNDAVALFRRVVDGLSAEQMVAPHAETRFGPVLQALVHFVAHFALHRGQMSYLARLVQKGR